MKAEELIAKKMVNKTFEIFDQITPNQLRELKHMIRLKKEGYNISIVGDGNRILKDFLESEFEYKLIEMLVDIYSKRLGVN